MKIFRNLIFLLTLFTLCGCFESIDRPRLDVDEAYLYTPKGKIEFVIDKKYKARLYASNRKYSVTVTPFPINKTHHLRIGSKMVPSIQIDANEAYYQLNDGEKKNLDIKGRWYNQNEFTIDAPKTIDRFTVNGGVLKVITPEDGMTKIKRKHIKKMNKDTYHYYIPFTVDNEKYTIDVTFRLTTSSSLTIGIPATP